MRAVLAVIGLAGCVEQTPDVADSDVVRVDTATTDPVCAGFGQPCDALPPRPEVVACGQGLRDQVQAGAGITWPGALSSLGCFSGAAKLKIGRAHV